MRAAIFDMDGVIVDDMEYHDQAWSMILKDFGIALTSEQMHERVHGKTTNDILADILDDLNDDQVALISAKKRRIFREIYGPHIRPLDGLLVFLDNLKRNRIRIALATSADPSNMDFIIDSLDIRSYFDIMVDSSKIRRGKPDPEIFLRTADGLGMDPKDCVVFEDSLSGIRAARDAGMKVIGVRTTHDKLDSDLDINDFNEKNLFESFFSAHVRS